jgi:hypothetical protein
MIMHLGREVRLSLPRLWDRAAAFEASDGMQI